MLSGGNLNITQSYARRDGGQGPGTSGRRGLRCKAWVWGLGAQQELPGLALRNDLLGKWGLGGAIIMAGLLDIDVASPYCVRQLCRL